MLPFLKFLIRRFVFMLITIFVITALLYGAFVALMPPEARAMTYIPPFGRGGSLENRINATIEEYGFKDPYLVQYARWIANLLRGDWGVSTQMNDEVLDILLQRTPATAELLLFSLLVFIPLGLVSGVVAGWKRGRASDYGFRSIAFLATSIPPFVLGLMLLAVFYIGLRWFPAGRISPSTIVEIHSLDFKNYTHLLVVDGFLNGRVDISLDALRHLILPAFTLSVTYWASLTRVTRAAVIEELHEDYITTALGKGLQMRDVIWRHAFRNAIVPGLNSIALSAAMFLTNAIVIEIVFGYPGISKPLSRSMLSGAPDVNLAMGFAVYSTLMVLPIMLVLDIAQGIVDPRIRDEVQEL